MNNSPASSNRPLAIESLRRALDALSRGDADTARAFLEGRRAPTLAAIAPEYAAARQAVAAANELYIEALRAQEAILAKARETAGAGPFLDEEGRLVSIVARARAGREQVFLRTVGPSH